MCVYESLKKSDFKYKKYEWAKKTEIKSIKEWAKKIKLTLITTALSQYAGKDSYRQAFYVRDVLKMNFISCNSYPPEQLTSIGAANMDNLIKKGFDVIVVS